MHILPMLTMSLSLLHQNDHFGYFYKVKLMEIKMSKFQKIRRSDVPDNH